MATSVLPFVETLRDNKLKGFNSLWCSGRVADKFEPDVVLIGTKISPDEDSLTCILQIGMEMQLLVK